ncbi:hypothetical protein TNCV_3047981 [Trichonephila clavipes]|nr:hypothetical protein TNCV_3047981 [Trichonephila clavipes]
MPVQPTANIMVVWHYPAKLSELLKFDFRFSPLSETHMKLAFDALARASLVARGNENPYVGLECKAFPPYSDGRPVESVKVEIIFQIGYQVQIVRLKIRQGPDFRSPRLLTSAPATVFLFKVTVFRPALCGKVTGIIGNRFKIRISRLEIC